MLDYIFIHSCPNYQYKKTALLDSIERSPQLTYESKGGKISTDYFINETLTDGRLYRPLLIDDVNLLAEELKKYYYNTTPVNVSFSTPWFQQYPSGIGHNIHLHAGSLFACVFFLELTTFIQSTNFIDRHGKEFLVKVKEGDFLIFPSFLLHYSPAVDSLRKTIISFNIDVNVA